jgi:hypothetical protein
MWQTRGGFQDQDLGRTQFDDDYGPEFGVDYARFADIPDVMKDQRLRDFILMKMPEIEKYDLRIRNGFVLITAPSMSEIERKELLSSLRKIEGVVEVIPDFQTHI